VRDFEQSGLSRKAFCTARGVALHTLDYYRSLARQTARSAGFSEIEAGADIHSAKRSLEEALGAEGSLPDLILLDLDLGQESGYEILHPL
jgi:hypothetical protein